VEAKLLEQNLEVEPSHVVQNQVPGKELCQGLFAVVEAPALLGQLVETGDPELWDQLVGAAVAEELLVQNLEAEPSLVDQYQVSGKELAFEALGQAEAAEFVEQLQLAEAAHYHWLLVDALLLADLNNNKYIYAY
jgi:hypothetical protein